MRRHLKPRAICFCLCLALLLPAVSFAEPSGAAIVKAGFNYYRGKASIAVVKMTIKRPDWQRTMTLKAWTQGEKNSLFHIISPPKDAGNGTLKRGAAMWMFNPKVNQVIMLPPSMMSQSWMGSDFSNNDLSKSDTLLQDYTHKLVKTIQQGGMKVYVIESTPKPGAPVVWSKQMLKIRQDHIFLEQAFYDEDGRVVKVLTFGKIKMLGGKLFPSVMTMRPVDEKGKYTRVEYLKLQFKNSLPARFFTLSALRDPRR